jgi:hypothetical protein
LSILRTVPILLLLLPRASTAAQTGPTPAERILAAASIPALARDLRIAGVSDDDVVGLLDALNTQKVPGTEARLILGEEGRAAAKHGYLPGLGSFVQAKLAAGLRGRALADAIQSEHAARGMKGPPPPITSKEVLKEKREARDRFRPTRGKKRPST